MLGSILRTASWPFLIRLKLNWNKEFSILSSDLSRSSPSLDIFDRLETSSNFSTTTAIKKYMCVLFYHLKSYHTFHWVDSFFVGSLKDSGGLGSLHHVTSLLHEGESPQKTDFHGLTHNNHVGLLRRTLCNYYNIWIDLLYQGRLKK